MEERGGGGDNDKHGSLKRYVILMPFGLVVREWDDDDDDDHDVDDAYDDC